VILTSVIDSVYSENHDLTGLPDKVPKLEEGKAIIATISRLKYGMARDRALEAIPADGEALVDEYNAELARLEEHRRNTWFTAPWLYAEYGVPIASSSCSFHFVAIAGAIYTDCSARSLLRRSTGSRSTRSSHKS